MNERFSHTGEVARPRPPGRLEAIAQAALELFSTRGYRRTQMADVAKRLGVSPGSLYAYVASKEALFELAVLRAFGARPRSAALPLRSPVAARAGAPGARAPAARGSRTRGSASARRVAAPADVAAELARRARRALRRARRERARRSACSSARRPTAPSSPSSTSAGCASAHRAHARATSRGASREGRLAAVPDVAIAARLAIETTAWFAWHRLGDPFPQPMDDALARATVIEVLARGLLPGGTSP